MQTNEEELFLCFWRAVLRAPKTLFEKNQYKGAAHLGFSLADEGRFC